MVELVDGPSPKQSKASLIAFLLVMTLLVGLAVVMVAPYVVSIIMGGILAMLANPFYRRLRNRGMRQQIAASIVTLSVVLLVLTPLLTISGLAVKQAVTLGAKIEASEMSLQEVLERVSAWGPVHMFIDDAAELEAALRRGIQSLGKGASSFVLQLASGVPEVLLQLILASLSCFFFLMDGRRFVTWLVGRIPLDAEIRNRLQGSFKDTAISVVWASMAASGAQAAVMLIAFFVLGVPAGFLAAGATFILAWIPLVGTAPVWIAGAIYLGVQGAYAKVAVMAIFGFLTSIVDNFVRPWVLKGRGEMHPLVSLVAIFGGINMFGIVGVFFGPILAAVVITVLQVWPVVGRRFGLQFPGSLDTLDPTSTT